MLRTILLLTTTFFSAVALASGGYGGGSVGGGSVQPRPIDRNYEYGKSIYLGRAEGLEKIRYCVDNGTEKVKLKRKSIKSFKNAPVQDLVSSLYDCDTPDTLIASTMSQNDLRFLMYYLNKRYRLDLK